MTVLGAFKHEGQIERAALATLQRWTRSYLGLLEAELGYPAETLPDIHPGGWVRRTEIEIGRRPEDQLPVLSVITGPTLSVERDGEGSYDAMWRLEVALIVTSALEEDTRDMAALYAVAVRKVLTQQPWIAGTGPDPTVSFPVTCRWVGNRPDTIDVDQSRTLAGMRCSFEVYVDGVSTTDAGPTSPAPLPDPDDGTRPTYPDPPTAETVDITTSQII
jgi:hypothetical protein